MILEIIFSVALLTEPQPPPEPIRTIWDNLADCESGEWVNEGQEFIQGSADWSASDGTFQGGLQFHPKTWDWLRPNSFPKNASNATRGQQVVVAKRVLEKQGWKAWPVCSRLLGLR